MFFSLYAVEQARERRVGSARSEICKLSREIRICYVNVNIILALMSACVPQSRELSTAGAVERRRSPPRLRKREASRLGRTLGTCRARNKIVTFTKSIQARRETQIAAINHLSPPQTVNGALERSKLLH